MSKRQPAQIYITKLAAAERQLNAAIRMTLAGEDELAIHTVAAAAYHILRDLNKKRGRNELADLLGGALHAVASELASGEIDTIPAEIAICPEFTKLVRSLSIDIEKGARITRLDVVDMFASVRDKSYWTTFNATANFLKHADRDSETNLGLDRIDNKQLLRSAIPTFSTEQPLRLRHSLFLIWEAKRDFPRLSGPGNFLNSSASCHQQGVAAAVGVCFDG